MNSLQLNPIYNRSTRQGQPPALPLTCGISDAFLNKALRPGYTPRAYADSFQPETLTVQQLIDHIAGGGAFTPALLRAGKRSNDTFVSAQLVGLDFDAGVSVAQLAAVDFVRQHAALVYPTASSTPECRKSRVLFVLDAPVTDATLYRGVVEALAAHVSAAVGSAADHTSDPARLFYGSTNQTEDWLIQPAVRLDASSWLERVRAARAAREAEQNAVRRPAVASSPATGTRAECWAAKTYTRILEELAAAPPKGNGGLRWNERGRNYAIYSAGYQLACKARGGWPGIDLPGILRDIEAIYSQWPNVKHSRGALRRGLDNSKPEPLILPPGDVTAAARSDAPAAEPRPYAAAVKLPPYTPDQVVSGRYLTDALPLDALPDGWHTLALKSPTGTGKTEWMKSFIHSLPDNASILAVTHRVALVEGLARRLVLISYNELQGKDIRYVSAAPRIATTVDSLGSQAGRTFDLLVIDEIEQVTQHMAAAGTLKERATDTYEVLKSLLKTAKRVIVADATLTDAGSKLLEALRGDVHKVENTYRPDKPDVTVYASKNEAIAEALAQVKADAGAVLIPCASRSIARRIHKLLKSRYPDKRGRIVTSRNSDTNDTKHFVSHINEALPEYDWLVYTSSMGTGVDITAPVAAVVGIFGQPLAPADALQMMNRARNAAARFASVPYGTEADVSEPGEIFESLIDAAEASARHGAALPDGSTRGLARLYASGEAERRRQQRAFLSYFAAHIQADGGRVILGKRGVSSNLKTELKAIAETEAAEEKSLTQIEPPRDNEEMDKIRRAGLEITDAIMAGHLRFKIEDTSGLSISEDLFDRLRTASQRAALVRLASLIDDQAALAEFDQAQAREREPLHRRKHLAAGRELFWHIVKVAFGVDTLDGLQNALQDMPADELANVCAFIAAHHMGQLKSLFGWRKGNTRGDNPIAVLRFILARFSLRLERKRVHRGGKLIYVYTLAAAELAAMLDIAKARIAARRGRVSGVPIPANPPLNYRFGNTPHPEWLDKANSLPDASALNPFGAKNAPNSGGGFRRTTPTTPPGLTPGGVLEVSA